MSPIVSPAVKIKTDGLGPRKSTPPVEGHEMTSKRHRDYVHIIVINAGESLLCLTLS